MLPFLFGAGRRIGRTYVTFYSAIQTKRLEQIVELFIMLLGAVGLVAIPLVLGITEWNQRNTMIAFYEIEPKVVAGALTASDLPRTANKIVHVAGPVYPQDGAADEYFSLGDQSFLRLRRRTEYCQVCHLGSFTHSTQSGLRCYPCASKWEQTSFTITTEDSAGNRRDPAPAREFTVPSAGVGPYTVPGSILERMDGWRSWIPSRDHVKEFQHSAATDDGFKYVGDGWFYSAYEPSTAMKLARFAGRFLEGSLDLQLGELFSQCTAGDVRVRFDVIDPPEISVVALQSTPGGVLTDTVASNGVHVGLAHTGIKSPAAIFADETTKMMTYLRWLRLIALFWGMVAVYACRRFVRPLASLGFWNCAIGSVAAAACIAALCHGIVWGATSLTALAVLSFCVLSFPGWIAIQLRDAAATRAATETKSC